MLTSLFYKIRKMCQCRCNVLDFSVDVYVLWLLGFDDGSPLHAIKAARLTGSVKTTCVGKS